MDSLDRLLRQQKEEKAAYVNQNSLITSFLLIIIYIKAAGMPSSAAEPISVGFVYSLRPPLILQVKVVDLFLLFCAWRRRPRSTPAAGGTARLHPSFPPFIPTATHHCSSSRRDLGRLLLEGCSDATATAAAALLRP